MQVLAIHQYVQGTHLFQFLTYTLKNFLLSFMVFVFGSYRVTIYYGLAHGSWLMISGSNSYAAGEVAYVVGR